MAQRRPAPPTSTQAARTARAVGAIGGANEAAVNAEDTRSARPRHHSTASITRGSTTPQSINPHHQGSAAAPCSRLSTDAATPGCSLPKAPARNTAAVPERGPPPMPPGRRPRGGRPVGHRPPRPRPPRRRGCARPRDRPGRPRRCPRPRYQPGRDRPLRARRTSRPPPVAGRPWPPACLSSPSGKGTALSLRGHRASPRGARAELSRRFLEKQV